MVELFGQFRGRLVFFVVVLMAFLSSEWAECHTSSTRTRNNKINKRASRTSICRTTPSIFPVHLASYKSLVCTAALPHSSAHPSAPISTTHIAHRNSLLRVPIMLLPPQQGGPVKSPADPLVLYSQSLRDYTLRLWMESRKQAEERVRARAHKKHHHSTKALATPSCTGGENEHVE